MTVAPGSSRRASSGCWTSNDPQVRGLYEPCAPIVPAGAGPLRCTKYRCRPSDGPSGSSSASIASRCFITTIGLEDQPRSLADARASPGRGRAAGTLASRTTETQAAPRFSGVVRVRRDREHADGGGRVVGLRGTRREGQVRSRVASFRDRIELAYRTGSILRTSSVAEAWATARSDQNGRTYTRRARANGR